MCAAWCWKWARAVGRISIIIRARPASSRPSLTKNRSRWLKPRSTAHIRLASADIEHLAFPDNTFDAVVATLVFCSVERPVVGFQEVRRVLKPGGQLHLIEHVRSHHHGWARWQDKLNPRWTCLGRRLQSQSRYGSATCALAGFEIQAVRVNYLGLIKTMVARKADYHDYPTTIDYDYST